MHDSPELRVAGCYMRFCMHAWGDDLHLSLAHIAPPPPSLLLLCRFTPPCCKIKHTDTYRCAHEWAPDTAVPLGDPVSGGPWTRDWPDHGSYEGGTSF